MKPRSGTDEWSRTQKNYTKVVGAHSRPHSSEDDLVFVVLKYTETGNVLETIRGFQRFPTPWTPCRKTIMDKYNKHVQYGLLYGPPHPPGSPPLECIIQLGKRSMSVNNNRSNIILLGGAYCQLLLKPTPSTYIISPTWYVWALSLMILSW